MVNVLQVVVVDIKVLYTHLRGRVCAHCNKKFNVHQSHDSKNIRRDCPYCGTPSFGKGVP